MLQNMIEKEEERKKILWVKKYKKPQVMIILVHEDFVAKFYLSLVSQRNSSALR